MQSVFIRFVRRAAAATSHFQSVRQTYRAIFPFVAPNVGDAAPYNSSVFWSPSFRRVFYCFLQLDNFFLKSIHAPVDASIVRFCFCGCAEGDAYLIAVAPPLLGMKTLPLDWDVQIQKLSQTSGLSNCSRAPISEISRTTQSIAVPRPSKYTKLAKNICVAAIFVFQLLALVARKVIGCRVNSRGSLAVLGSCAYDELYLRCSGYFVVTGLPIICASGKDLSREIVRTEEIDFLPQGAWWVADAGRWLRTEAASVIGSNGLDNTPWAPSEM